jgi:hypothetical protein
VCAQAQRAALPSSQSLAGRSSEGAVSPFRPPGSVGTSPALDRDYSDTHRMLLVEQASGGRAPKRYTYDVHCWSWNMTQPKLLVYLPPREAKLTVTGCGSGSTGTDLEPLNIAGTAVGTGSTGLRSRRRRYRGPAPRAGTEGRRRGPVSRAGTEGRYRGPAPRAGIEGRYRGPVPRAGTEDRCCVWSACPLRTDALPTLFRWRSMPKGVGGAATDGGPSRRRLSASRVAR